MTSRLFLGAFSALNPGAAQGCWGRPGGWREYNGQKSSANSRERLSQHWGRGGTGWALTSADALLLPRQDARAVDDADTLQDLVGQLGAHEPGREGPKMGSETVPTTELPGLSRPLMWSAVKWGLGGD